MSRINHVSRQVFLKKIYLLNKEVFPLAFDGILINTLTEEIREKILLGKIDKIHQPNRNTIIFYIRKPQKTYKLLLSNHPQTARFHITKKNKTNPASPPLFCMVLRKHLENGRLIDIQQKGLERIVYFIFENYNELGEKIKLTLVGEFMGKHSNLILINPATNLILDSIKRLTHSVSQFREVLPGISYISPPPQNKLKPEQITESILVDKLMNKSTNMPVEKGLLNLISGISPQTAKELCIRGNIAPQTLIEYLGQYEYEKIMQSIIWLKIFLQEKKYSPIMILDDKKPIAFAPFNLELYSSYPLIKYTTISELVEDFIGQKEETNRFKQKSTELEKVINKYLDRCHKKILLQQEKLIEGEKGKKYRIWGELLTANLYHLQQGEKAVVKNFYNPSEEFLEIPMDAQFTPNENAQKYFKKYNKTKSGADNAKTQIQEIQEEINYLESIKESLIKCDNIQDLEEVRNELEEEGYVKKKTKRNLYKSKEQGSKPLVYNMEGFTIYVGKNNKQNDFLTLKVARSNDIWLHTKDIPGSHVIIKNPENKDISEKIMDFAANLAAYYSKGKNSSLVPVDYTLKKYVKKPKGAKPGMVIYENQKTIYITPDTNLIKDLKA